ncbi:MAG: methyltransferase domain-containing protein [Erysipelotrichaceae bacterium]|nr:methyltransferase domain-containing protein [Erysipelotrichaceae bacterium]
MKKYYEAYDSRYKTVHEKGYSWSSDTPTPIVRETIDKYSITKDSTILEIGCGEGRDAFPLLKKGYQLLATDISPEVIRYCRSLSNEHAQHFEVLDCLNDEHPYSYDFIYAVAVVHMLVEDRDRHCFYQFINHHLNNDGIALICSMGDGITERHTDVSEAFDIVEREHESGTISVTSTSMRMVSFETFEREITENQLQILEKGLTSSLPDFNCLMYAVVRKKD